jgi:predicted RNA binding protein YcfA (HicA-like mRNA interferase family)
MPRKILKISLDNTIYILYIGGMTAREVAIELEAHGWMLDRIKGSHHIYAKDGQRSILVPFHGNKNWVFLESGYSRKPA